MNNTLLDTNILIYYLTSSAKYPFLENFFIHGFTISIISKIELLGWTKYLKDISAFQKAEELISFANIILLDNTIADTAIEIRKNKKIKLGDSIIAGTCKVYKKTLITRNTIDFVDLGIQYIDPFS